MHTARRETQKHIARRAKTHSVTWHLNMQKACRNDLQALLLVGVFGLEPKASSSRTKRATNCAIPRRLFYDTIIKALIQILFSLFSFYVLFTIIRSHLLLISVHDGTAVTCSRSALSGLSPRATSRAKHLHRRQSCRRSKRICIR